jgi:hypothetical protein
MKSVIALATTLLVLDGAVAFTPATTQSTSKTTLVSRSATAELEGLVGVDLESGKKIVRLDDNGWGCYRYCLSMGVYSLFGGSAIQPETFCLVSTRVASRTRSNTLSFVSILFVLVRTRLDLWLVLFAYHVQMCVLHTTTDVYIV